MSLILEYQSLGYPISWQRAYARSTVTNASYSYRYYIKS